MRYLILTYYRKVDGKIDEVMALSRNLKPRDLQTANVILDFREQRVIRCMIDGQSASRDWDHVVSYYYKHYATTIEQLFQDNGHPLSITSNKLTA
jgi:hypothetical protein